MQELSFLVWIFLFVIWIIEICLCIIDYKKVRGITTNGPAIWGVCVAERMKVVTIKASLWQNLQTQP